MLRFAPLAALLIAVPAFAADMSSAPSPPQPVAPASPAPIHPSDADYARAQLQTLLETVQRLTPQLVEERAKNSALETQHQKDAAEKADLIRKLADATKSTPAAPADSDKAPAEPAK